MSMEKEEFQKKLAEWKAVKSIVNVGMPQANEHERRSILSREANLSEELASSLWFEHADGTIRKKGFGRRFFFGALSSLKGK